MPAGIIDDGIVLCEYLPEHSGFAIAIKDQLLGLDESAFVPPVILRAIIKGLNSNESISASTKKENLQQILQILESAWQVYLATICNN